MTSSKKLGAIKLMLLGKRIDPTKQEVFKLLPKSPPMRGERILVDDVRCTVTYCRTKWNGPIWTIRSLRVKELES